MQRRRPCRGSGQRVHSVLASLLSFQLPRLRLILHHCLIDAFHCVTQHHFHPDYVDGDTVSTLGEKGRDEREPRDESAGGMIAMEGVEEERGGVVMTQ